MKIDLVKVNTAKLRKAFIDFPHDLYKTDPNYVPELYISQKEMFDVKKYPFYEFGKVDSFLAFQNGKIVGRICAIDNVNYNNYHNSNIGFFGFFDVIENQEVANLLLERACQYAQNNKRTSIQGPTNFSTNETAGLLIEGFDSPPKIMMTYNKPYYQTLIENFGFKKEMDLLAYLLPTKEVSAKSIRIANMLENRLKKQDITVRKINFKDFKNEVEKIKKIYNAAWEKNWGFVPFTDGEFKHLADGLKMLASSEWCYLAEHGDKPIGFSISLPNINEILIDIKRGRLFPTGIFKLLWRKNKTKTVRILALGVLEEYRRRGIEAIFFSWNILEARRQNMLGGEASWILDSNVMMKQAAENLNGIPYKKYRLFSLDL